MELGFFTMPLHPPGADFTRAVHQDLEQLIVLDELGFKEAWIGEHFTSVWESLPSPELLIAMAIPQTKRMVLATGVTCMPNHNPFAIAHRIATLDHLARGRFHWGVGSGGFPGDFEVFGFDPARGEQRMMTREAIDTVLRLWEDPQPGVYEHKYWRFTVPQPQDDIGLRLHVRPFQRPHPPIGVAGVSAKSDTLLLAGERGWIPMSINIIPMPVLRSHWMAVEQGAHSAGRTPDRSMWRVARNIFVADTTQEARRQVLEGVVARDFREYLLKLLAKCKMLNLMKVRPEMSDAELTMEYLVDHVFIVGSPDDVVNKLQQLHHDVGGFGTLLAIGHEWEPRDAWIRSMTLLKTEVMPKLAAI
ncbi:MAG TPA: LLM class flavin-dependent oxidoreductase [Isosphaeraceae bacterium]|nr:LLM class flavin-dependent oxidoreductase [Isosphaeraceae bacterium]